MRQAVGDDRFHARLAERAARLLVGQDRLQLHHLAGQRLDVVLRGVDDGQALLQLGQAFMRRFGLLGHGLAEPAGHGVEALADRLRQFGLPCAEHLGDRAEPALHLGLRLQDAGHAGFRVAGMVCGLRRSCRARLGGTPQRDDQRDEQARNSNAPKAKRLAERDDGGAEAGDRLGQDGNEFIHAGKHTLIRAAKIDQNRNKSLPKLLTPYFGGLT